MWLTILALIISIIPFSLALLFRDRLRGIVYVLAGSLGLHMLVAIVTQAFRVFDYSIVLGIHILVAVGVLFYMFLKHRKVFMEVRLPRKFHPDYVAIGAMIIILFELWSVHYSYNGVTDSHIGLDIAQNSSYTYPMYSDEWVAVSLIDYAIRESALPMVNPLNADSYFINFLAGFHIVVAEIMLFFNLVPLTSYVWLAILNTLCSAGIIYTILRKLGVGQYASAFAVLLIPLLTNSGNLPGPWFLLPYNLSLTTLLLALLCFSFDDKKLGRKVGGFCLLLSLMIYPPMIVFVMPVLLSVYGYRGLLYIVGAGVLVILVGSSQYSFVDVLAQGWRYVLRDNLDNGIVSYGIWNVIPVYAIPFAMLGIWRLWKKRIYFLLAPTLVGGIFWLAYIEVFPVLIIEPARIVAITSIFLVICAGFGLHFVIHKLLTIYHESRRHIVTNFGKVFFVAFFITGAIFFPGRESWQHLLITIRTTEGATTATPAPPVNYHLRDDELEMFNKFEKKRFISPPWKGLVLAVATHNYPMHSKSSTVGNKFLDYSVFEKADCKKKRELAVKHKLDYAYTKEFQCSDFELVGQSREGLYLYVFRGK